jgi:hypothetical protein
MTRGSRAWQLLGYGKPSDQSDIIFDVCDSCRVYRKRNVCAARDFASACTDAEPIPLPKAKPLATLRDAALYITKLPKAEHDATEWQAVCVPKT